MLCQEIHKEQENLDDVYKSLDQNKKILGLLEQNSYLQDHKTSEILQSEIIFF